MTKIALCLWTSWLCAAAPGKGWGRAGVGSPNSQVGSWLHALLLALRVALHNVAPTGGTLPTQLVGELPEPSSQRPLWREPRNQPAAGCPLWCALQVPPAPNLLGQQPALAPLPWSLIGAPASRGSVTPSEPAGTAGCRATPTQCWE